MRDVAFLLLGMLVGVMPAWFARKRRLRTHWSALRAEIILCGEKAKGIFSSEPRVMAPLYRLPLMAYQVSFPVLLADGALSEEEVLILGRFFGQVQDINRGLDNAAEMNMADKPINLGQEFSRNCLKAQKLVEARDREASLYVQSLAIVERKINQSWWRFARNA